jgi:hypothetical protein
LLLRGDLKLCSNDCTETKTTTMLCHRSKSKPAARLPELCFLSLPWVVTIDHSVNEVPGPYVFKINSHCHHLMGSLTPSYGEEPKSAQLYS